MLSFNLSVSRLFSLFFIRLFTICIYLLSYICVERRIAHRVYDPNSDSSIKAMFASYAIKCSHIKSIFDIIDNRDDSNTSLIYRTTSLLRESIIQIFLTNFSNNSESCSWNQKIVYCEKEERQEEERFEKIYVDVF